MQCLPSKNRSMRGFSLACICVSNIMCTQESNRKVWHLAEIVLSRRKVHNRHHLGINSSLTFTQGTEAKRKEMLWSSSSFGLISPPIRPTSVTKISIRRGGEGDNNIHFQDKNLQISQILSSVPQHISLLSLLRLPAVPPLPTCCSVPTTRWRRVFCSGNSVCRTHCWLSEVLLLFRRLLGASGPTGGVFYHLSGLGTGSGS